MRWDPDRYTAFADDRGRPFHDLVAQVAWPDEAGAPRRVVDLGCGPGTLTATLAQRWPGSTVLGIDSSAEMLASVPADVPGLAFALGAIEDWTPGPTDDVVVTNAALQWVPEHVALLPGWLDAMPSGAWFAMQVPGNFGSPSHARMRAVAAEGPWASVLTGVLREDPVLDPAGYLGIMLDAGFAARAWETTYAQLLPGDDPVLAWVRGTGLRPVLAALDAADPSGALTDGYVERYSAELRSAYPAGPHGTVYPFRRVFAVGRKP